MIIYVFVVIKGIYLQIRRVYKMEIPVTFWNSISQGINLLTLLDINPFGIRSTEEVFFLEK